MPRQKVYEGFKRLNLRVDEKLMKWAFNYAKKHNVTVTYLFTQYLQDLKRKEKTLYVEQI